MITLLFTSSNFKTLILNENKPYNIGYIKIILITCFIRNYCVRFEDQAVFGFHILGSILAQITNVT